MPFRVFGCRVPIMQNQVDEMQTTIITIVFGDLGFRTFFCGYGMERTSMAKRTREKMVFAKQTTASMIGTLIHNKWLSGSWDVRVWGFVLGIGFRV